MKCHARLSIFLSLLIFIFFLTLPANASFSDVPPDHWASEAITALASHNLLIGYGDGRFGPNDTLSVSQLATVITRLRGGIGYNSKTDPVINALSFCCDTLDCLPDHGEITEENYNTPCSREVAAYMIVNGLRPLLTISDKADGYAKIPDLADATYEYWPEIATAYQNHIIVGVDERGAFSPRLFLTRAQLAVILYRAGITTTRLEDIDEYTDEQVLMLYRGIIQPPMSGFVISPTTEQEFLNNLVYMNSDGNYKMVLQYPYDITYETIIDYCYHAIHAVNYYPELGYKLTHAFKVYTENSTEDVKIVFYFCDTDDVLDPEERENERELFPLADKRRADTLRAALGIRRALHDSGALKEDMSELEKARALYLALLDHVSYDNTEPVPKTAHSAYAALCSRSAVCDGYTAAYNLLLRLEGIDCHAIATSNHMWSIATLDGVTYHIDATWGESRSDPLSFFAMSPDFSREIHRKYGVE